MFSTPPAITFWNASEVIGKLSDCVTPATAMLPGGSKASASGTSSLLPPQVSQPHQLAAGWIEFGQERIGE